MDRSLLSMVVALGLGCSSGLPTGRTEQAQIDPGMLPWRSLELRFTDLSPLAVVYIIGGRDLGSYEAHTEHWFVNRGALARLGQEPLLLRVADQYTAEPPTPDLEAFTANPPIPDSVFADPPGVADPPEPDLQIFTQPVYPEGGWGGSWLRDPIAGGVVVQSGDLALRLFVDADGLSRVVWYQLLERRASPANITPAGVFSVVDSVRVPDGFVGYSIDLAVE